MNQLDLVTNLHVSTNYLLETSIDAFLYACGLMLSFIIFRALFGPRSI